MGTRVQGWTRAATRGSLYPVLAMLLVTAVAGCGGGKSAQTAGQAGENGTQSNETMAALAQEPGGRGSGPRSAHSIHRINLTSRGCIRFEPQWTEVRVGQPVVVHSDLGKAVRIYVSPGVFARDNYLVGPGATVSMGTVRTPGRYSFWTEPSACREAPRGVLLAGPGVKVEETFYASAPGVK